MFQLSTVKPVYFIEQVLLFQIMKLKLCTAHNVKRIKSTWSYDFSKKTTLSKLSYVGFVCMAVRLVDLISVKQ